MKFSIPYTNGLYNYIANLSSENKEKINDVYFSDNKLSSNRLTSFEESFWDELHNIKKDFNIKLNYTVNPSFYDSNIYLKKKLELVGILQEAWLNGCEILTFNNSILLRDEEFRTDIPDFDIKLSVNQKVTNVEQMEFYIQYMGIYNFVLDRSVNRNMDALIDIYKWCQKNAPYVKLSLMVNEGCISQCPWKQHCDNMISTYHTHTDKDIKKLTVSHSNSLCGVHFLKAPSHVLKSPFITPHGLNLYKDYVKEFKIVGRMLEIRKLSRILNSYLLGTTTENLQGFFATETPNVYNTICFADLEEYNFSNKVSNCKNKCTDCNFCDNVLLNIIEKRNKEDTDDC